jgi:spermidine dehydrogenase
MTSKLDKELGLNSAITRRDFVYGSTLVIGGALVGCGKSEDVKVAAPGDFSFDVGDSWYGPGGVGDYASSHGNTPDLIQTAHQIRAGRFDKVSASAIDSGEEYDLVIVGGGFAGLSAAHHFHRLNPSGRALILDNHPIFGGEAKRNDFEVNGVHISGPQGSNDCAIQAATGDPDDYFSALNIPREFQYTEPGGSAAGMRIAQDNYEYLHWHEDKFDVGHFFRGADKPWVKDVWKSGLATTPWSDEVRQAFARVRTIETEDKAGRDTNRWLDSMTMKSYFENELGLPPEVSSFYDPIMASIIGLGCDAISAYWGLYFQLPGFKNPDRYNDIMLHSFPGGNAGIARHFVKQLIPDAIDGSTFENVIFGKIAFDELDRDGKPVRIRLNSTAVRVEHEGKTQDAERVRITYARDGQLHQLRAKSVVMASGGWVNRHVIRDLPDEYRRAYESFAHSPVLVANVALTNWRFLERLGVSAAIWSGGFGFTCNIRRPMIVGGKSQPLHPDEPIVLTFYAPIYKPGLGRKEQGIAGRAELLGTSFADYERQIREQMMTMFSASGFDPVKDIAGIILNRWGHAYTNPGPGFRFGLNRWGHAYTNPGPGFRFGVNDNPAPPDVIREPFGRIAIGHSELRGHQYWSGAAGEGRRAVEALLDLHF